MNTRSSVCSVAAREIAVELLDEGVRAGDFRGAFWVEFSGR
jgi:hypothetical protein